MLLRTEVRSDLGIWPGLPNKRWVHVEYVDEGPTDLGTVGLAGGLEYYEPVSAIANYRPSPIYNCFLYEHFVAVMMQSRLTCQPSVTWMSRFVRGDSDSLPTNLFPVSTPLTRPIKPLVDVNTFI